MQTMQMQVGLGDMTQPAAEPGASDSQADLAFKLPGSSESSDDLPDNVKPGDAAGLPQGPTAKPPSGPSLPKVCNLHSRRQSLCTSHVGEESS